MARHAARSPKGCRKCVKKNQQMLQASHLFASFLCHELSWFSDRLWCQARQLQSLPSVPFRSCIFMTVFSLSFFLDTHMASFLFFCGKLEKLEGLGIEWTGKWQQMFWELRETTGLEWNNKKTIQHLWACMRIVLFHTRIHHSMTSGCAKYHLAFLSKLPMLEDGIWRFAYLKRVTRVLKPVLWLRTLDCVHFESRKEFHRKWNLISEGKPSNAINFPW